MPILFNKILNIFCKPILVTNFFLILTVVELKFILVTLTQPNPTHDF